MLMLCTLRFLPGSDEQRNFLLEEGRKGTFVLERASDWEIDLEYYEREDCDGIELSDFAEELVEKFYSLAQGELSGCHWMRGRPEYD